MHMLLITARSAGLIWEMWVQMADFVAHALLKQVESPVPRVENHGIDGAFSILDRALNRQASRRDPQGVVRR